MVVLVTEYKGAKLAHIYRGPPVSVTVAVDKDLKLHYEGPICLDHLSNSYKYGEEVHLITYQKTEPKAVFRVNKHNGYYRIEMHFSEEQFDSLVRAWIQHKAEEFR